MKKVARRKRDREATEKQLLETALTIMKRDGVLAGLNLATVADEAGVNRGQIYQYFGNRQNLLRAALEQNAWDTTALQAGRDLPFAERRMAVTRSAIDNSDRFKLMALLILDGDPSFPLFPNLDRTRQDLARDQEDGSLNPDRDALMCHLLSTIIYMGYGVFREKMSDESGVPVEELDDRLLALTSDIYAYLATTPRRVLVEPE